jgi:sec-independent protein translocase protein TatA
VGFDRCFRYRPNSIAMSFGPEWFIVLGVLVLLFGAKKIPELAKSLGQSVRELRKAANEEES